LSSYEGRSIYHPEIDDPRVVFVGEPGKMAHPSDSWRVGRPAFELAQRGYNAALLAVYSGEEMAAAGADVLVIARQTPDPDKFKAFVQAMHQMGTVVVLDWDDSPNFHPVFHKGTKWEGLTNSAWQSLAYADACTATTPDLRDHLRQVNPRAYWLPNLIAPQMWWEDVPSYRPTQVTVGVMGGDSHDADWKSVLPELWPRLAERYPDLHFVVVGYRPDWLLSLLPSHRLTSFGWSSIFDYPKLVKFIDVGLAPLTDTEFNRMKSPIKWQEYTLAGATVVASPVMYNTWIMHGQTGLIARTPAEWFDDCCQLIESTSERHRLRDAAAKEVLEHHTFSDEKCRVWMDVYKTIYREVFGNDRPHHASRHAAGLGQPRLQSDERRGDSQLALPHYPRANGGARR
jgi:hypothetical protein